MKKGLILLAVIFFIFSLNAFAQKGVKVPIQNALALSKVQYVPNQIVVNFRPETGVIQARTVKGEVTTNIASVTALCKEVKAYGMVREFPDFKPGSSGSKFEGLESEAQIRSSVPDLSRYYVVTFDESMGLKEVMEKFKNDPNVEHVEPIGIHPVYRIPDDTYFDDPPPSFPYYQWNFKNAGDHDVDADLAWDLETGSSSILIGILDTGVRYIHRDLGGYLAPSDVTQGNVWVNWAEYPPDGDDDDGNGFVDDWVGWDWVNNASPCWSGEDCTKEDNDPADFNGHGTHVGGIVGAITNNTRGVAGLAGGWNEIQNEPANGVKIMALRVGWSAPYGGQEVGYVRMDFCAQALYYAANKGATAVNCSWGSSSTGGLPAAADYATARGVLIVAAAGNDGSSVPDYLQGRSDVLSVAATDSLDRRPSWSNYGTWVDVSAPGVNIISTYHNHNDPANDYVALISGTSQACPHATGLAGLLKSFNNSLNRQEIFDIIVQTTDTIDHLNPGYEGLLGSGRINAYEALRIADPFPPVVTVIWPNGGEVLFIGHVYTILWEASDNVGIVSTDIDYSTDGGNSWTDVVELEGNPEEYDWTVPGPPTSDGRIRVTCYDYAGNSGGDMSDSNFCPPDMAKIAVVGPIPKEFAISQNYPNPFNPETFIEFSLPKDCQVNLIVYNVRGQLVKTLVHGSMQAGTYKVRWDGTDKSELRVASGVYFYRLAAGDKINTRKMIMMK
jgi:subtilisin family serine protease